MVDSVRQVVGGMLTWLTEVTINHMTRVWVSASWSARPAIDLQFSVQTKDTTGNLTPIPGTVVHLQTPPPLLHLHLPIFSLPYGLSARLSQCRPAFCFAYMSVCLLACLSAYLPACLSVILPAGLPAGLLAYLSVCLHACPSFCLPTCLSVILPA